MKRDYTSGIAEKITFFTGKEIEHTPAFGMDTLFVVGCHEPNAVLDIIKDPGKVNVDIKHIYFGANQSFNPKSREEWLKWTDMVHVLLESGYWCTLDFDVTHTEQLHEWGLTEKRRFIPMISVKLPSLQLLGYNATLKLDDIDFDATNPGVWCHRVRDLTTTESFTHWDQYKEDNIVK